MRFHDAMPRCSMLVTQPNAIIGQRASQVGVERDELAERDAPADHLAAAEPEHQQRPEAEEERHARERTAPAARSAAGCARRYSSFDAPEPLELVRLLAVRADHAHAGERLLRDGADVGELRLDRARSAGGSRCRSSCTEIDTNGSGISATQRQPAVDRQHQDRRDDEDERPCCAEYMTAGPIIMRTAFRSFVARDIRSPVRCAWKYAERQLLEVREEVVPHVVLDVRATRR